MTAEPDGAPAGHDELADRPLLPVDLEAYVDASELLRALSAPLRLAIIDVLADGDRCVHELVDALAVSQPLVSQHLKTLRAAHLVITRRRGREVVYRLADDHVAHVARDALSHARESATAAGRTDQPMNRAPTECQEPRAGVVGPEIRMRSSAGT